MNLKTLLIDCAHEAGFPLAGTVDLDLAFSSPVHSFENHIQHYDQWIESGFAGSMNYLIRGRDRRANPRLVYPQTESILCVALPYPSQSAGANDAKIGPRYARYLQGEDYHFAIAKKLEVVMQNVKQQWNSPLRKEYLDWKICVDTSAVLERSWAALAGLGWIGKNTLLIHPRYGSYLFLGEVLVNQKTGQGPKPLPSYCGNCKQCLSACPTQAFEKAHVLNSNRCISYMTLEKRGALALSEIKKKQLGTWVAGCDVCQESCPFNIKPSRSDINFPGKNATDLKTWESLLAEDILQYQARVKHSSMKRIKPQQFRRNLAISLGNFLSGLSDIELTEYSKTLQRLLLICLQNETDEIVLPEWQRCLMFLSQKI